MKTTLKWFFLTVFVMLALPFLTVTFAQHDAGMAICFLLFFAVDPIYAVIAGAFAGKDVRNGWFQPLLTALLFLAGTWLCFDPGETEFLKYAGIYTALGFAAMAVTFLVIRHRNHS